MLKTSKANLTWLQVKISHQGSVCHWPGRRQHREMPQLVSSTAGERHGLLLWPCDPPHSPPPGLSPPLWSHLFCPLLMPLFKWVWKAQTAPKVSPRPISLLTPCKGWTVLVCPGFVCWSSNASMVVTGGGDFGRWLVHEGEALIRRDTRELALSLPCEDTSRRTPSARQEGSAHQNPNMLASCSGTSNLQKCEK